MNFFWFRLHSKEERSTARIIATSAALGLALVWAGSAMLIAEKRRALIDEKGRVLERTNSAIAAQTGQLFKVVEIFFVAADHWFAANPDADPRFDPGFNRLIEDFHRRTGGRIDIRLNSREGGLYIPPSESEVPLANVAESDFFRAANNSKEHRLFVGAPMFTKVWKRWIIPVSYPLHSQPHGISVIAAAISLPVLEGIYEEARDRPNGSITLMRGDGVLLARQPRVETMIGKSLAKGAIVASLLPMSPQGLVVEGRSGVDGKPRILSYRSVPDFPLVTVVTAEISDTLVRLRTYAALVLALALAVSAAIIVFSARMLKHLHAADSSRRRLSDEAKTDPLTGAGNRRLFLARLDSEMARARRYGSALSLLMVDLDHFKAINDRYGHRWGDQTLVRAAAAIQSVLRGADLLGRYGGEEFIVLLPETDQEEALMAAERIHGAIRELAIDTGQGIISVRISIGVASLKPEDGDAQGLIHRADQALYAAKGQGRDRTVLHGGPE